GRSAFRQHVSHVSDGTDAPPPQTENASATRAACSRLWRASAPTAGLALASRTAAAIFLQKIARERRSLKVHAPISCGSSWRQTNFAFFGNGLSISRSLFSARG